MIVVIVVGVVASLFAAMKEQKHRFIGFCGFFCTNICWITYGVLHVDYNVIMQFGCFLVISSIGLWSNRGSAVSEFDEIELLKQQTESLRRSNAALRKRLEAYHRDEARRLRYDHNYVEYPDDDYDR